MTTYPGYPTPPAPEHATKLPGRVGIWVGITFIAIGIVLGAVLVVGGFAGFIDGIDDLERVPIDTGGQVELRAGSAEVYAERPEYSFGSTNSLGGSPDLTVTITGPSGQVVPVDETGMSVTVTINGTTSDLIGSIEVPEDGTYDVEVIRGENTSTYETIGIGDRIDLDSVGSIVAGFGFGGFFVLVGGILILVFGIKRSNARKARSGYQPAMWPPGGYPPPYPMGGYPGAAPPPFPGQPGAWGAPPPPQPYVRPDGPAPAGWVPPPAAPPSGAASNPPPPAPPADPNGPIS